MIQDIEPNRLSNEYIKKGPDKKSCCIVFKSNQVLVQTGEVVDFLSYESLQKWCDSRDENMPYMVYLFGIGEISYFLTGLSEDFILWLIKEKSYQWVTMHEMRSRRPKEQVFVAATAWHLFVWYRDNRFCGRCGKSLLHSEKLRMLQCPDCGNMIFPKIAPAVIVGVIDGDRILMTKYAGRAYKRYALVAGFTEIGETAEQTVAREVMEETGVRVKNIRYYKSQPWGFDSNLLLGYFCDLDGDAGIHIDTEELSVAEWVDYRDIQDDAEGLSLTREMMVHFRDSRREQDNKM